MNEGPLPPARDAGGAERLPQPRTDNGGADGHKENWKT